MNAAALLKTPDFRRESGKAFIKGLAFAVILMAMLCGWAALRSDETRARWEERIPSKTVLIQDLSGASAAAGGGESSLSEADLVTPGEAQAARRDDADSAFQRFRKAVPLQPGQARLAIVLGDIGVSSTLSKSLIEALPPSVTLAFSPYAATLGDMKAQADAKGFESWMMLPLEPEDYPAHDTGPLTIGVNAGLETIQDTMSRLLALAQNGYPGFISPPDHVFTDADLTVNPAMRLLADKGFGFAEGRNKGNPFARAYAAQHALPYARADERINRHMERPDIQTILQRTEKLAQLNGSAVLVVEPTPLSFDMIREWIAKLPGRNIQLVPLSVVTQ